MKITLKSGLEKISFPDVSEIIVEIFPEDLPNPSVKVLNWTDAKMAYHNNDWSHLSTREVKKRLL